MLYIEYPKCTTCKRAKKYLDDHGISYTHRDIKEENPTAEELGVWYPKSKKAEISLIGNQWYVGETSYFSFRRYSACGIQRSRVGRSVKTQWFTVAIFRELWYTKSNFYRIY